MFRLLSLSLLFLLVFVRGGSVYAADVVFPNRCNESCGSVRIPHPFHLNSSSCGLPFHYSHQIDPFRLYCSNTSLLSLDIGNRNLRVIDILSDAIIVDVAGRSGTRTGRGRSCHLYDDMTSFHLESYSLFFGISGQNLLRLYACGDSSICKVDCHEFSFGGCGRVEKREENFSCCYSLSEDRGSADQSEEDDGPDPVLAELSGCRGFSSWVVAAGTKRARRGLKLEWALPREYANDVCAPNAGLVNSTVVPGAVRCSCHDGLVGDGFAQGFGCVKCK